MIYNRNELRKDSARVCKCRERVGVKEGDRRRERWREGARDRRKEKGGGVSLLDNPYSVQRNCVFFLFLWPIVID